MNNTATGGFRQEGLPRKRWEGTLVICVEHIFIWAETERHKNPRRGREVICPDSSFTLPRCNTDTHTQTHKRKNAHAWTQPDTHRYRDTEPPSPPNTSGEVNHSCRHRNVSRGVCVCVDILCVGAQVSGCCEWPCMCTVSWEKYFLNYSFWLFCLFCRNQTASLWVSCFVSLLRHFGVVLLGVSAPLHSFKTEQSQWRRWMAFPGCKMCGFFIAQCVWRVRVSMWIKTSERQKKTKN